MPIDAVGDSVVAGGFIGPSSGVGVVSQGADVVELVAEQLGAVGVWDEVVALLADVGVRAGTQRRARVSRTLAPAGS